MNAAWARGRAGRTPAAWAGGIGIAAAVLALAACAGKGKPAATAPPDAPARAPRMKDTVPERLASLPGVDKESEPDNVERRFGPRQRPGEANARAGRGGVEVLAGGGVPGPCADVAVQDAKACPLAGVAAPQSMEDVPGGARLIWSKGAVDPARFSRIVRCHALLRGPDAGACPFDVGEPRATVSEEVGGRTVVEIVTAVGGDVGELRRRAVGALGGTAPAPAH